MTGEFGFEFGSIEAQSDFRDSGVGDPAEILRGEMPSRVRRLGGSEIGGDLTKPEGRIPLQHCYFSSPIPLKNRSAWNTVDVRLIVLNQPDYEGGGGAIVSVMSETATDNAKDTLDALRISVAWNGQVISLKVGSMRARELFPRLWDREYDLEETHETLFVIGSPVPKWFRRNVFSAATPATGHPQD